MPRSRPSDSKEAAPPPPPWTAPFAHALWERAPLCLELIWWQSRARPHPVLHLPSHSTGIHGTESFIKCRFPGTGVSALLRLLGSCLACWPLVGGAATSGHCSLRGLNGGSCPSYASSIASARVAGNGCLKQVRSAVSYLKLTVQQGSPHTADSATSRCPGAKFLSPVGHASCWLATEAHSEKLASIPSQGA